MPQTAATQVLVHDDRRRSRRFPVWVDASLRASEEAAPVPAMLVDISMGGGLLRSFLRGVRAGQMVFFAVEPDLAALSARVLRTEHTWNGTLYHVQFQDLSAAEEASLAGLLDQCRPEFEAHQRYLARRSNASRQAALDLEDEPAPTPRPAAPPSTEPPPAWDELFD